MSPSALLMVVGEWLAFTSIYGLVMLAVASLATRLLRRGAAADRARIWWFALLSMIAVPVGRAWHTGMANLEPLPFGSEEPANRPEGEGAAVLARDLERRSVVIMEEDVRIVTDVSTDLGAAGVVPSRGRSAGSVADAGSSPGREPVDRSARAGGWGRVVEVLAGVWVAGAVLAWFGLLASVRSLARIRGASRASGPSLQRRFQACKTWLGVRRAVDLRVGDTVQSPVLIGGRSATVVLPTEIVAALGGEDLDAVFLHELAHAARGDDWARFVERALVALFWFHPAIRIAARKLDEEREMACDDMAAAAIGSRRSFAHSLLRACEVVIAGGSRTALVAPAAFRDRGIGDRVRRLVRSPEPGCPSLLRGAAGLLMLGVASAAIGAPEFSRSGAFLAAMPGSPDCTSDCTLEEAWRSGVYEASVRARYGLRGTSRTPFGRILLDRTGPDGRTRLEGIARARGPVEWVLFVDDVLVTDPDAEAERADLAIERTLADAPPAAVRELRAVFRDFGRE